MSDTNKGLLSIFGVLFVVTLGCLPLILLGPQTGGDYHFQLPWSHHFAEQVRQGEIYPRWLMNMNAGAGSPTFFYYAPVPFYFSTLASFALDDSSVQVKLGVGQFLAVLASAFSFYFYARQFAQHVGSAVGAILYAFAPYHFGMNLLYRQAFGELTAYVWIPLVFLGIDKIASGRRAEPWLALTYGLLVMTHLPTALIGSPFFLLYAILMSWFQRRLQIVIRFMLSVLIGLMIGSCYLLPALATLDEISAQEWWIPYFDYHRWFFFDNTEAPNAEIESHLFQLAAVNFLLFVVAWPLLWRQTPQGQKSLAGSLLALLLGTWLMMTPASTFIWELFPLLQKIQFPWRVMTIQDFAWVATVAAAVAVSFKSGKPSSRYVSSALVVTAMLWIAFIGHKYYQEHLILEKDAGHQEKIERMIVRSAGAPSHLPQKVRLRRRELFASLPAERVTYRKKHGEIEVVQWKPREIVLDIRLSEETQVTIKQFSYYGWHAVDQSTEQEINLTSQPRSGLLQFNAKSGDYRARLTLRTTWQEKAGWILTGLGLLITGGLLMGPNLLRRMQTKN